MTSGLCGRPKPNGAPCGYRLNGRQCPWHGDASTPESRQLHAFKGSVASRLRTALPSSYHIPEFTDEASILAFARELARMALKDDVDLRRVAEARGAASLALSAVSARSQAKLVDALLRLEHGGAAVAMLAQFQGAQNGPRRPLPGRVLTLPTTPEPA